MDKKTLTKIKKNLESQKQAIMDAAEANREKGLVVEEADLPDEVDLATSETGQALNFRLRDRELTLLKKIDKTLNKIEKGEYGDCSVCGEKINKKRLEARPVTDLCIQCKEEQEKREKGFAD